MRRHSLAFRTLVSYMALYAVADLFLGCSTTHIDSVRASVFTADSPASLSVSIYETVSAEHKRHPFPGPVGTRLLRDSGGVLQLVREFTSSTWSMEALPPGRYCLQVLPDGLPGEPAPRPIEKERFTLKAGDSTTIAVILKDRRGAYWTAMGVGIGAVVVALLVALVNSISHTSCTVKSSALQELPRQQETPDGSLTRTRTARR